MASETPKQSASGSSKRTKAARRHSRNRLVLIGSSQEQEQEHQETITSAVACTKLPSVRRLTGTTGTMIDDAQAPAPGAGTNLELDEPELRKHPSKLTHGFWLRRYSGLHEAEQSPGVAAAAKQQQQVGLLTRWTNAMMLRGGRATQTPFGGSTSRVGSGGLAAPPTGRSGACSAPPATSSELGFSETAIGHQLRNDQQQRRRKRPRGDHSRGEGVARCSRTRTRERRAGASRFGDSNSHSSAFGCPFCGWRSGVNVASSSSYSSFSSSSSTPSLAQATGTKASESIERQCHESVPQLLQDATSKVPATTNQRTPIATQGEETSCPGARASGSLLSHWLLPSVTSPGRKGRHQRERRAANRSPSDRRQSAESRLSSYGHMKRFVLDRPEAESGETTTATKSRRLASLLFISPRRWNSHGQTTTDQQQQRQVRPPVVSAVNDNGGQTDANEISSEISAGRMDSDQPNQAHADESKSEWTKREQHFKLVPKVEDDSAGEPNRSLGPDKQLDVEPNYANEAPCGSPASSSSSSSCELMTDDMNDERGRQKDSNDQGALRLVSLARAEQQLQRVSSGDQNLDDGLLLRPATSPCSEMSGANDGLQPAVGSSGSLLPLIRPLASSSSSFASSSACNLDSTMTTESVSQQHLVTITTDQENAAASVEPQPDPTQVALVVVPSSSTQDYSREPASRSLSRRPQVDGREQVGASGRVSNQMNRPRSQPVSSSDKATGDEPTPQPQQQTSATGLRSNFKKLVKRQQSVDSYRMAREQKQKLKREQQQQSGVGGDDGSEGVHSTGRQHQSTEAIRARSYNIAASHNVCPASQSGRKFSMRLLTREDMETGAPSPAAAVAAPASSSNVQVVEICVDPYARPGSFMLPGEQVSTTTTAIGSGERSEVVSATSRTTRGQATVSPTPPNTLSLMPVGSGGAGSINGASSNSSFASPGNHLLTGSGFSGCITPTYPTHHLPSPKYVSPAAFAAMQKKHSNASTISSLTGVESLTGALGSTAAATNHNHLNGEGNGVQTGAELSFEPTTATNTVMAMRCQQASEGGSPFSSLASSRRTSRQPAADQLNGTTQQDQADGELDLEQQQQTVEAASSAAAADAQRRANLAEHIYDNKCGLGEDMKFLASLPEMCDITFLVGETREPVCAVKSVLGARSRVFHKILFGNRIKAEAEAAAQRQAIEASSSLAAEEPSKDQSGTNLDRRSSSPRQPGGGPLTVLASVGLASKSSSRSNSPNQQQQQQQQQQQWSVISNASGLGGAGGGQKAGRTVVRADSSVVGGGRSGRVSVASNGRESQTSQGSQQPLIIGPGQTATPAPIKKGKRGRRSDDRLTGAGAGSGVQSSAGHSRLSRMFTSKRASDPSIKHHHHQAAGSAGSGDSSAALGLQSQSSGGVSSSGQSYLDKMSSSQRSTTMIIEEFEPDVFRQLIEYIHTGCVLLQARTLLGLLNASDYYGLEQLRRACLRFVSCCITVDTVCSLLSTAERYIQYKCTKSIVQKVLEFVDTHANDIFKLNAFGLLPEHVVRLILARDGLQADELVKYNGVYTWCEHYCRSYELTDMSEVMKNFLDLIQFHKIPTNALLTEIYPTHIVPDEIFLSALAYQADPEVFEPRPSTQRRMTLPTSLMLGRASELDRRQQRDSSDASSKAAVRRQSQAQLATMTRNQPNRRSILSSRKTTGDAAGGPSNAKVPGRKGSFAQVSSGVKRFSQRLPLRKRHSNVQSNSAAESRLSDLSSFSSTQQQARQLQSPQPSPPSPSTSAPKGHPNKSPGPLHQAFSVEPTSTGATIGKRQLSLAQSNSPSFGSSTNDTVTATAAALEVAAYLAENQDPSRSPIQMGRQILDAYLAAKRQQELEERARQEAEQAEQMKKRAGDSDSTLSGGQADPTRATLINSSPTAGDAKRRPLAKSPSYTRKSFRDFKHISRRLFTRHLSSKSIQVQQQQSPLTDAGSGAVSAPLQTKRLNSNDAGQNCEIWTSQNDKKHSADQTSHKQLSHQDTQKDPKSGRRLLRVKRSETVFETTTTSATGHDASGPGKRLHQLSANLKRS